MKKTFLLIMLCCMASISVIAQNTKIVKGAVIDKNGNPLPGAVVEATGGAENAVVDADGTFSIEVPVWLKSLTAKYAGMKDKKKNINGNNLIFEMRPNSGRWFVNLVGSYACFGDGVEENYWRLGLMGGYMGNWGGYAKLMFPFADDSEKTPSVSLGVIKRLDPTANIYLGVGYAHIPHYCYYCDEYEYSEDALLLEIGTIVNLSDKINMNVGFIYNTDTPFEDFNCESFEVQLGIGYRF